MNRLPCPACKTTLQFPDDLAGRTLSCPKCKKVLRVSLAGTRGRRQRRKQAGSFRPLFAVGAVLVLLMAAGGIGFFYLADEGQSAPPPKSPPTQQAAAHGKDSTALPEQQTPVAASEPQETASRPKPVAVTQATGDKIQTSSPAPVGNPEPAPKAGIEPRAEDTSKLEAQVLARLNALRVRAGVMTVRLDKDLSRRCRDHAGYLVRNGILRDEGASPYWEDAQLPGFSEPAARMARFARIDDKSPLAAIDRWAASSVQRALLLNPRLQVVGLGMARAPDQESWTSVFHFPLDPRKPTAGAVLYPADQQAGVPLTFPGNEVPDPLPDTSDKVAGFPITVTFPAKARIDKPTFDLEDERGKPVDVWSSWPGKPANKRYVPHQQNTICLIAKKPLRPGSRYSVRVSAQVDGKRWTSTWSFVTLGHDEHRHEMESRVVARLNAYRKASGLPEVSMDRELAQQCAAHASYLARNVASNPGLNLKDEDPKLPGYSEEGRRCARRALLRPFGGPDDLVDGSMASILNRNFLLNPDLTQMGVGFAPRPGLGYYWVLHVRVEAPAARAEPILFPADKQQAVPRSYPTKDRPSPIPAEAKTAGFAITALFPAATLKGVEAHLTDKDGKEVECWLHTPDRPLIQGAPAGMVGLLPRQILAGDTDYKVSLTADVNGQPRQQQWTFHTVASPEARQQEMATRILARLNEVRKAAGLAPVKLDEKLSRPCLLHARYLVTNAHHAAVQGLGVHSEDLTLPDATPEGAKAAKASVICRAPDALTCVDDWVCTLYHRIPLLSPDLKRIGFGAYLRYEDDDWYTVLDSGSGK